MKQFSEFNVAVKKSFVGKSILVEEILEREIEVQDFVINPSTKKQDTDCLHLQLKVDGEQRVLFTGSEYLMVQIKQVLESNFPFTTKIYRINRHFEFT